MRVAQVLVDSGLVHLDRPFEYLVPEDLDETAQPGVRVKVRFAGRDLAGYVVERSDVAEHTGRLAPIRTVVSPEQVLTPEVLELAATIIVAVATLIDLPALGRTWRYSRTDFGAMLATIVLLMGVKRLGDVASELVAAHPASGETFELSAIAAVVLGGTLVLSTLNRNPRAWLLGIVAAILAVTWVIFILAERVDRLLGETGRSVLTRLLGVILSALAVQFVADGVRTLMAA